MESFLLQGVSGNLLRLKLFKDFLSYVKIYKGHPKVFTHTVPVTT